jgi:hypothetical protein
MIKELINNNKMKKLKIRVNKKRITKKLILVKMKKKIKLMIK